MADAIVSRKVADALWTGTITSTSIDFNRDDDDDDDIACQKEDDAAQLVRILLETFVVKQRLAIMRPDVTTR